MKSFFLFIHIFIQKHSCYQLIAAGDVTDKCSGRGVMDAMTSKCTCESPYAGERCSSKGMCLFDENYII